MARNTAALASVFSFLVLSALASAGPSDRLVDVSVKQVAPRITAAAAPCSECDSRTPILESGRPPLPREEGSGVQSCTLINTSDDWDAYCDENIVPDCPLLDDAFFAQSTVVAVAIDTVTTRPCEGSPDPVWKLDCVQTATSAATVRVVKQRPGGFCQCSAMPQHLQRLFLATAVPKTTATACRACEEDHTIGCLR